MKCFILVQTTPSVHSYILSFSSTKHTPTHNTSFIIMAPPKANWEKCTQLLNRHDDAQDSHFGPLTNADHTTPDISNIDEKPVDDKEIENIVALDEGDIALLKTYVSAGSAGTLHSQHATARRLV
jgi:hypothetical protein